MNNVKNLKLRAGALAITSSILLIGLAGCEIEAAPKEDYDIVGEQTLDDNGLLTKGLKQELNVKGEEFKLIAEYQCDDEAKREWRVTSDKYLYLNVYTKGLPEGTEVYIDNIHIDTSIKSEYACMDGILQDTMDDRIHNSLMLGFPINDTTHYYGVNAIEGCNDTFIKGTFYGYYGYAHGEVSEERYTEKDYKQLGVYANKFQIVYDLLVKGANDNDYHNVSVNTDFLVPISQKEITYTRTK